MASPGKPAAPATGGSPAAKAASPAVAAKGSPAAEGVGTPEGMKQAITPESQKQQPGMEFDMKTKPIFIRDTYKGSEKLKGKVALITGGDSGIGRSVAVHFVREGADVAIVYLPSEEKDAAETEALIQKEGRKCARLPGDVGSRDAIEKVVSEMGSLDILVNNASEQHYHGEGMENITEQELESTFRTNVFGYFWMCQAALKHMKPGASIINTTSVVAYRGSAKLLSYSATKGAETALTRSLSSMLVSKGIRVNAVAPGPIWTPLIPATFPEDKIKEWKSEVPMDRPGQPAEVGPSYVFLASEDASYYSGQTLHPDGGSPLNT